MSQSAIDVHGHSSAVRGIASGVLFMSFFGTLWACTGIIGLQGWGASLLLVITAAICIALFISGGSLIKESRKMKDTASKTDRRQVKHTRLWFNVIFAAEGLAIAIAIAVCIAIRQTEQIPLIIAIIVGIHFFPLALLFQVRHYHFTGGLLCLLAVATWLFMPEEIAIRGHQINAYMSVVGIGSALILWGTGLAMRQMGKRLITDSL